MKSPRKTIWCEIMEITNDANDAGEIINNSIFQIPIIDISALDYLEQSIIAGFQTIKSNYNNQESNFFHNSMTINPDKNQDKNQNENQKNKIKIMRKSSQNVEILLKRQTISKFEVGKFEKDVSIKGQVHRKVHEINIVNLWIGNTKELFNSNDLSVVSRSALTRISTKKLTNLSKEIVITADMLSKDKDKWFYNKMKKVIDWLWLTVQSHNSFSNSLSEAEFRIFLQFEVGFFSNLFWSNILKLFKIQNIPKATLRIVFLFPLKCIKPEKIDNSVEDLKKYFK